jgi:undecaprenyl-diphosphatase
MNEFYPFIEDYGSLVVFFGVMLGCSGIPFPSAAILIAAGVLIQQGHLQVGFVVMFGILGAIIGNQIGYWAGLKGGRAFVLKWGSYVKITPERLEQVERLLARYGGKAVFASRFFSVTRVFGALVAGTSRMRFGTFLFSSLLSGVVWATAVVFVGYYFGHTFTEARHGTERAPLLLALVLAVALGIYLVYQWVRRCRGS